MSRRPQTPLSDFENALMQSNLTLPELTLIEHIRCVGVFNQLTLTQGLSLKPKPPPLTILCKVCRKIGDHLKEHYVEVMEWSALQSPDRISWHANLVCSVAMNCDGDQLTPEAGTAQYHTFVVHKELFNGLDY